MIYIIKCYLRNTDWRKLYTLYQPACLARIWTLRAQVNPEANKGAPWGLPQGHRARHSSVAGYDALDTC